MGKADHQGWQGSRTALPEKMLTSSRGMCNARLKMVS